MITQAGQRAELPFRVTGHYLRSGLATTARLAGRDLTTIATQGRWVLTSRAPHGYLHKVGRWQGNATPDLGL